MAFKPWFPFALIASAAGGFLLWWSLTDYERARYYPILIGIPAVVFAFLGVFGISGQTQSIRVMPPGQFQLIQPAGTFS